MLISTKHLKPVGCDVHVKQDGVVLKGDFEVEIYFKDAKPLRPEVHDEILNMIPPQYGEAVIEDLMHKIHTIQVMEAINRTEAKAWRDR